MNKYRRFFAILKQVNKAGLEISKEDAVYEFTNERTEHLSDLSAAELFGLEQRLSSMISSSHLQPYSRNADNSFKPNLDPTADRLRKAIISQFLSIGKTTVRDAKEWAERYGVNGQKKHFNEYTNQELWLLRRNAEKMKRDHINSIANHLKRL